VFKLTGFECLLCAIISGRERELNYVLILQAHLFFLVLQILELPTHPFYVGVQFHPEFKSRPRRPSALFLGIYQLSEHLYLLLIKLFSFRGFEYNQ